jgi:methylphosphotriester-DNA--protein-cysteine methyltransferase
MPSPVADSRLPPIRVAEHTSTLGFWSLATRAPPSDLADVVVGYSGFSGELRLARELHLPTGLPAIVANLGAPFRVFDPLGQGEATWQADVGVMGPHARPFLAETPYARELLVATLTPAGAYLAFGRPMSDLANRWVPLDGLVGADGSRLGPRLRAAASWEARFACLDGFLDARLARARQPVRDIHNVWLRAQAAGRVSDLAEEVGVSHKHLVSLFHEQIGLTPRLVARLARFNRALRRLGAAGRANWADAAQACGYFDQSHLINDFRDFAAATPRQVERARAAFSYRA